MSEGDQTSAADPAGMYMVEDEAGEVLLQDDGESWGPGWLGAWASADRDEAARTARSAGGRVIEFDHL